MPYVNESSRIASKGFQIGGGQRLITHDIWLYMYVVIYGCQQKKEMVSQVCRPSKLLQ